MNDMLRCIMERRSIRKYRPEQITQSELDAVLQAGLYAPSAGGRQGVLFVVSQDANVNDKLGRINKSTFQGRVSSGNTYISREQPSIADDVTIQSAFYSAPTVVTLFGARGFLYAASDCAVAAGNMMLVAHALGVGSCMIGRAKETFDSEYGKGLLGKWEVDEAFEPVCHVILGYVDGSVPQAKARKENRIIKVNETSTECDG